ncbi:hypothetical protein EEL32_00120 (plasmid) [Brevibacillus laterosporus]|nr:hypothetical protein [Brevibacillus laterosporus]TPG93500.1 hypothetical protein EEL32_00120 [Brevibacillus laterosporus]
MKKSMVNLFLAVIVLLITAVPAFAASSSSVTVGTYEHVMSGAVDGAGQYGKITLSSSGDASLYVYYNKGDGVWKLWTINEGGKGWIFLGESGGTDYLDFYMNYGWQYKIEVFASSSPSATGTIKNS